MVLQGNAGVGDLTPAGAATQLLGQFDALCQSTERLRLTERQQAATGIDDQVATIGIVTFLDQFLGAALQAEAKRFVQQ
ncbi:hypothetical protein D3C72_2312300 [compost metagenome]